MGILVTDFIGNSICYTTNLNMRPTLCERCFLEQETLPLLLSTGWFQERIRA